MSVELFIARHIYRNKSEDVNISPPAVRVAIVSMALGLAIMLLSVAITAGFKKEVSGKVIGFGGNIRISNFDSNSSYEMRPIALTDSLLDYLRNFPNIDKVNVFASKIGILKTDSESYEAVFKGYDANYDSTFLKKNLKTGCLPAINADSATTQVLISGYISDKLNLKTGDSFLSYFLDDTDVRARKFTVSGIYVTNFQEGDKLFVFCDVKQIRRINGWDDDMASGIELTRKKLVTKYSPDNGILVDATEDALYFDMQSHTDRLGNTFYAISTEHLNPMIFDWLAVIDTNVWVILVLMLLVAGFSMISGLMIIILERANMIGILKAMGENNASIRKTFFYVSGFLIVRGLAWGNAIGLGICLLQKTTGFLRLNPEVYYLESVPIDISITAILLLNAGTLILTLLMLVFPSFMIAKISPAKTIRFE